MNSKIDADPIHVEKIFEIKKSSGLNRRPITSASGLIKMNSTFYIIADDDTSLFSFSSSDPLTKNELSLTSQGWPDDYKARKKVKADWESLIYLPDSLDIEGILVIPSGSTPNRMSGVLVQGLNQKSLIAKPVDFSYLYQKLQESIEELNIEGAVILDSELILFQRGNGKDCQNSLIKLDLNKFLIDLKQLTFSSESLLQIIDVSLGSLTGQTLSFTDACEFEQEIFFLAVAEDTDSTYHDGVYRGSVLGKINNLGQVLWTRNLVCPEKPEGLWLEREGNQVAFYLVTDSDDPNLSSGFYKGYLLP